jgi:hypothetical protein
MLTTKIPYTISALDDSVSIYRNIFAFRNTINSAIETQEAVLRYVIKDGDTPRSLANLLYGAEYYDWVICTLNNIVNPYYDWPLSEESFYEMMEEKYISKQCFFVDLTSLESDFVEGETITQGTGNSRKTAIVDSWDKTLGKLTIKNVSSSFGLSKIFKSNNLGAVIKRIVERAEEALHHFETPSGGRLDPYVGFLDSYLNGIDTYAITNKQNELNENDKKRNIYILKPDYLMTVVSNVKKGIAELQNLEVEE